MINVFNDISKLDRFFLRLQMETGIELFERKSVIIFVEIQLFPKARQAIKYLVKDERFSYLYGSRRNDLYYYTWRKEGSTHSFEIDFLLTAKNKVIPIEVKSSSVKNHKSIDSFETR